MIYDTLKKTGLPVRYSHFTEPQAPPYLVYTGNGQNTLEADDTIYWRENVFAVEYYFEKKDLAMEELIEDTLLGDGYIFEKSEDNHIEDEGVFVIYYYLN